MRNSLRNGREELRLATSTGDWQVRGTDSDSVSEPLEGDHDALFVTVTCARTRWGEGCNLELGSRAEACGTEWEAAYSMSPPT